jgi:predicted MFS family arabinose efflux permease
MEREKGGKVRVRASALLSPLTIPEYRTLWAADMISLLGDWAGRLALTVLVLERTDSPAWAAAVTAVSLAGFVGIGQVLATLADRFGRIGVMLVADIVRAGMFAAMLLELPVGVLLVLAFLAGLATPPFEAARSAALPDIVPEERYGDALALSGVSVQGAMVGGSVLGGVLLVLFSARGALAVNAATFLVSAVLILRLRHSAAAAPSEGSGGVGGSLRAAAANLFGDRMVRRAMVIIVLTSAFGTVDEALLVPYADGVGISNGLLGLLAATIPIGTIIGTVVIARSADHHVLLRTAAVCTTITAAAAAPLFWFEVGGAGAFVAFAISGGMFAASIPVNIVIGTRLARGTRASAMGIAVGVLFGSQALGAAVGGVVASAVGPPRAIAGALALAAGFGAWAAVTTPLDAKHLAGRHRGGAPSGRTAVEEPTVVVDLVALESRQKVEFGAVAPL